MERQETMGCEVRKKRSMVDVVRRKAKEEERDEMAWELSSKHDASFPPPPHLHRLSRAFYPSLHILDPLVGCSLR